MKGFSPHNGLKKILSFFMSNTFKKTAPGSLSSAFSTHFRAKTAGKRKKEEKKEGLVFEPHIEKNDLHGVVASPPSLGL